MLIKRAPRWQLPEAEVTPEPLYRNRRQIIQTFALGAAAAAVAGCDESEEASRADAASAPPEDEEEPPRFDARRNHRYSTGEPLTSHDAATSYNNFYEFGVNKSDPARYAYQMTTRPWSVRVEGHVEREEEYAFEDLIDERLLEDRIYRLRCVEAWSMVVPWIGVPLNKVIAKFAPTADARYVQFVTKADPTKCRAWPPTCSTGPMWRACGWTRPCIR